MQRSNGLRLRDVRQAFRLIGECRELGADSYAWRRHLLDGLRRLTGAQLALYLHLRGMGTKDEEIASPLDTGFLDRSQIELWGHYQREKAQQSDPFHLNFFCGFRGRVRTRALRSVVDAAEWHRSMHYNEYIRACALEDRITSALRMTHPGAPSTVQVLVLHRAAADGDYEPRSVRLVQVIHEELRGLLGRSLSLPSEGMNPRPLPGQLQQVLCSLLQGDGEKQVAARLGISRHTVNRHVQRLYRRFGVHSRGELLFHCRHMLPGLSLQSTNPVDAE